MSTPTPEIGVFGAGAYDYDLSLKFTEDLGRYGTPMERGTWGHVVLSTSVTAEQLRQYLVNEAASDHIGQSVEVTRYEVVPCDPEKCEHWEKTRSL